MGHRIPLSKNKYTQIYSGGTPRWNAEYVCRKEEIHFTCWVRIVLVFCSCHGYTVGFVHVTVIGFLHKAVSGNHISDPTICTRIMQRTLECGISVGLEKIGVLFMLNYGVATISRLLQITSLFCRIPSLLWGPFAKETYNLKKPTNHSHPIVSRIISVTQKSVLESWRERERKRENEREREKERWRERARERERATRTGTFPSPPPLQTRQQFDTIFFQILRVSL